MASVLADVPPPPPAIVLPADAHLVLTADGQRLALPIPVRARPAADGRTTVRLRATVRLPDGQNLRPTPSARQHVDRDTVIHRVLFSPASTRRLLRLARRPKLTVRAFAAHDADGDGHAERASAPTAVVGRVPPLRRRPPEPVPAPPGPREGPCSATAAPDACVVVGGEPWTAPHRWATFAWRLACPPGTAPAGADAVTATGSHAERSAVVVGAATWVEITDDAAGSAPRTYAPSAACVTAAAGG